MKDQQLIETQELPLLLTGAEACREMRISRTRLYELIRGGLIRSVKVGRRGFRIPRAELERVARDGIEEVL
jgi:excisionase family DNA binding protein